MRALADLGHPLAQRRHRDLAADDHARAVRAIECPGVLAHQQHERDRDDQLVGHRIEEGAEPRRLPEAPGEIAVERVRDARGREQQPRGGIGPRIRHVEQHDDQRNRDDAQPRQGVRPVPGHRTSGHRSGDRTSVTRVQVIIKASASDAPIPVTFSKSAMPARSTPCNAAEVLQQLAALRRAQARDGLQHRLVVAARTLAPVTGDREAVRLVAHPLDQP